MIRSVKRMSIFSILLLLSVFLSPFRIWTSDDSRSIFSSQTPSDADNIRLSGSCVISSKIRPGDILLIEGNTWIDKVIRLITGSSYTHVAGVVNPDEAIEILPFKKTGYQKLRTYAGRAHVFTYDNLTDEQRRKITEYIFSRLGTKYDYKLVLWEASRYLLHWVWSYKAGNSTLCSTLWAEAYRKAGVDLCPDIIYPSPGDLGNSPILQKIESY